MTDVPADSPEPQRVVTSHPGDSPAPDMVLLNRLGVFYTTLFLSLIIILISGSITLTVVLILDHPLVPDMYLGLGIPVLLGPPVAYLMARFRQLYSAAESASKTKSDFLSSMSHDLESPLHGIISLTEILQEEPELKKQYGREIAAIRASGQHLLELIDDLLNYSRLEAGVMTSYEENFDLSALLEKLLSLFRVRCEIKGLDLRLEISSELPMYLRGDQQKLFQVLANLVGNALKFTSEGGIRIVVCSERNQICFRIQDTGPGIAPEELDFIFEPFTRSSRNAVKDGTGLGLAISRWYVEFLGGELTVESQVGQGSTFQVLVPMRPIFSEQTTTNAG